MNRTVFLYDGPPRCRTHRRFVLAGADMRHMRHMYRYRRKVHGLRAWDAREGVLLDAVRSGGALTMENRA